MDARIVELWVQVTAEDIANGEPLERCACPVALAIQRLLKPELTVDVMTTFAFVYLHPKQWPEARIDWPLEVQSFIRRFDDTSRSIRRRRLSPFSFTVNVPENFLRQPGGAGERGL